MLPPLVLGGMFRDAADRSSALERLLDAALAQGLHAIDTAPLYGFGEAERVLGRFLRTRRGRVTVLGKVGLRWDDAYGDVLFEAPIEGRWRAVRRDSRPRAVRRDVEQSLERLGVDALDLVQIHHRDRHTPLADTLGELLRLRDEGKLREIGVSNFVAADLQEAAGALGAVPLASTQERYSLLERDAESEVLPWVRAQRVGFLAYSPLARGLLAGRLAPGAPPLVDGRRDEPLFQPRNASLIQRALDDAIARLARGQRVTPTALALAWVVAVPGVTAALVGAQDADQLDAACAALRLDLTPQEHADVGDAFARLPLARAAGVPLAERLRRRVARWVGRLRRR